MLSFNFPRSYLVFASPFKIVHDFYCYNGGICPHSLKFVDFEEIVNLLSAFSKGFNEGEEAK